MDSTSTATTFNAPNQYARPARLELSGSTATFHGYQEFVLTRDAVSVLPVDGALQRKRDLLDPYFQPRYLARRTVLDLGANAAFFCFWALQNGAEKAVAVDLDPRYLEMVQKARARLGVRHLETVEANVAEWNQPADVVLALALIHWIYSCTALFGSLDAAVERLAQLTGYLLLITWIEPEDPAIAFFHHIDWNKPLVHGPYTREAFEAALDRHFVRWQVIGDEAPTRRLYAAFRTPLEIDLSCPLPLIASPESVIYSRFLTSVRGVDYWSRIHDAGDVVYKQATLDLAEREAFFLSQFDSPYFPRVRDVRCADGHSVVTLEKIAGESLPRVQGEICANVSGLHQFFQDCLSLLIEVRSKGIRHRDIRPENLMVRDGRPVLMDFAWAISDARPYITPPGLGDLGRPPDGSFCDVYAMGKVFEAVNDHRYPMFDGVIDLMTEPNPELRLTDLATLKALFTAAATSATRTGERGIRRAGRLAGLTRAWQARRRRLDRVLERFPGRRRG